MISSAEFKKYVSKYFAPKLRAESWKGTGFHYKRKTDGPFVHFLSFQPDTYGGKFWIEVGVHMDFLKKPNGGEYIVEKMNCTDIDIRRRVGLHGLVDQQWMYGNSEESNFRLLETVWSESSTDIESFCNMFRQFPGPLADINPNHLSTRDSNYLVNGIPLPPDVRTAWILAQLHLYIGNKDLVKMFSEYGISKIEGRQGIFLKKDLEFLKKKADNTRS